MPLFSYLTSLLFIKLLTISSQFFLLLNLQIFNYQTIIFLSIGLISFPPLHFWGIKGSFQVTEGWILWLDVGIPGGWIFRDGIKVDWEL